MEEPLKTLVAGMIGGGLMGMIFVGHMALLLVYNPPRVFRERAVESTVSKLITILTLITFLAWNAIAIAMAFIAQATLQDSDPGLSFAPSPGYLAAVVFLTLFIAIPALVFFRDKIRHLVGELALFVGVFGLLIPNLVVAVHGG